MQREQIAKTESLFRNVNERIAEASERFDSDEAQFLCECAHADCAERLEVRLEEYEEVREDGTTFLLNPDHIEPEVERVVSRRGGYAIVRKVDDAVARIARQLNPRANPSPS